MLERTARTDDSVAHATLDSAGVALSARRKDIPASFVAQLYARAVPEDVVRYGADDIAAFAEAAYDFIAEIAPGTPKVRCDTVQLTASGER